MRHNHFFLTGTVLIYKGIDKPADVIAQRKLEYCNRTSVFVGHYGLCGDKVCVLKLTLCLCVILKLLVFFFYSEILMFSIC